VLAGYADLVEIGGGAFATVYRAVETETGRPVALKILKVDTIHAHLIETFHREIQALAAVSDHPNIVTLYRPSTTADGRPALVLELCRESLAQQVRTSGPLDPVDVTRVGIRVAGALETAHRNGFLHRDMKPQNILVTQFGEPALADFGVAALQASAQSTAGVFGFTTLHAAPEMLEGQNLSPATDVYGLASTMYQLLTGQAPFATYENEAPASVILRILRDPVRPLRVEHVPISLADLLEAALSKAPEGRPRSALEFAQALQSVEAYQGWPETRFVAWGAEGAPAGGPDVGRGPMGMNAGTNAGVPAEPPIPTGPPLVSSPGIIEPTVARTPVRSVLPPLLPSVGPGAQAGAELAVGPGVMAPRPEPSSAIEPASPIVSAPPVGPAPAADDRPAAGEVIAVPPREPPPPPARPVRPSLVDPDMGVRAVVDPVGSVRGGPVPPPEVPPVFIPPSIPGPPVSDAPPLPASVAPPTYIDPPVDRSTSGYRDFGFADPEPPARRDTPNVYEQTMGVQQLLTPAPADAPQPAAPAWPIWVLAGVGVAVVVIVVAILLIAGVI
jgi:hypothetical protein